VTKGQGTAQDFNWRKLGKIWETTSKAEWMQSHSANPVSEPLGNDRIRIYFSCRNAQNVSSIAAIVVDLNTPHTILSVSETPILSSGSLGLFDDSGASMGCLVHAYGKRYLYYLGWNLGVTVPWRNSIGLAISDGPDSPFYKVSDAPILDRNDRDPYSLSYPWVMVDESTQLWRMWYGSNSRWGAEQRDMAHGLKYAESSDGIHWEPMGEMILPLREPNEYAQSKPCVIKDADCYRLWYSYRGDRYRIGYAESFDGRQWERFDEKVGIDVSSTGWDSEMLCYPNVFDHAGKRYMLYNGNAYGKTGIGLAVLVPQ
jgi:hypothetical protein